MKRIVFLIALSVLATSSTLTLAGTVTYTTFYSPALQEERDIAVYLPSGYSDAGAGYPVIYKLHPMNSTHLNGWNWLTPLLDTMIGSWQLQPVIVVAPNGAAGNFGGSMWTNSILYGRFEDYVVEDLVAYMDATYNTIPIARKRALLGFSMGAIGSMTIGLSHPDIFGALAAQSGYFNWDRFREGLRDEVLIENPGPPYNYNPSAGMYSQAAFMVSGGYSPNLLKPPYCVDFPLDAQGNVVETVLDRWKTHNPAVLAAALPQGTWPDIYFDCGTMDEFYSHPTNLDLAAAFDSMGVPYEFRSYIGYHNTNATKMEWALTFLNGALGNPAAAEEPSGSSSGEIRLHASRPNPVSQEAVISFDAPPQVRTSLRILDVQGRVVESLLDGCSPSGGSSVRWQCGDVPAGTYFYELRIGEDRQSRKLTVAH